MVQAARSGVQNIAEGSVASGTSKKMELKLTNVAKASLAELRLDYEDFLRQRGLESVAAQSSGPDALQGEAVRYALDEVSAWVKEERSRTRTNTRRTRTVRRGQVRPCRSVSVRANPLPRPSLVANAALSLLNLACYLLDRQLAARGNSL